MNISRDEARRIAELAHLEFDEAGLDRMAAEMTKILTYIDQLREVQADGFEEHDVTVTPFREDEPRPSGRRSKFAAPLEEARIGGIPCQRGVDGLDHALPILHLVVGDEKPFVIFVAIVDAGIERVDAEKRRRDGAPTLQSRGSRGPLDVSSNLHRAVGRNILRRTCSRRSRG